jgi:hypothetical protein
LITVSFISLYQDGINSGTTRQARAVASVKTPFTVSVRSVNPTSTSTDNLRVLQLHDSATDITGRVWPTISASFGQTPNLWARRSPRQAVESRGRVHSFAMDRLHKRRSQPHYTPSRLSRTDVSLASWDRSHQGSTWHRRIVYGAWVLQYRRIPVYP